MPEIVDEVLEHPLYGDSDLNPFVWAEPGDVVIFEIDDRTRGNTSFAWWLKNIRTSPMGGLDYDFVRVDDRSGMCVDVHSDGSGYKPQVVEVYKKVQSKGGFLI